VRARIGATALLVAAATALVGCAGNPPQTQLEYDPSDGLSVRVGDVHLLNLIVLTEDGEDGNLIGAAVNRSEDDIDLVIQYESDGERTDVTVELPADSTLHLGSGEDGQLLLPGIGVDPGELVSLYFQYGDEQGKQKSIPVLDGSLPEYSDYLPTPTPTPTPTATETATAEPTPSPTPTP
jgi:hypothetical protein